MKRTSLVLAAIVLTSCAARVAVDEDCSDVTATVKQKRNKLISYNRPEVGLCQGNTLTITIEDAVAANKARSTAQDPNQTRWLSIDAADGRTIVITVPNEDDDDIDAGDEFKYTLTVDDVGSLDPIIRIIQ